MNSGLREITIPILMTSFNQEAEFRSMGDRVTSQSKILIRTMSH